MKAVYHQHCARKGTTPEKMIAKIEGESLRIRGRKVTPARGTAERRAFPKTAEALKSTRTYVEFYFRLNRMVNFRQPLDGFAPLSDAPTTWPDGPDGIVTVDD